MSKGKKAKKTILTIVVVPVSLIILGAAVSMAFARLPYTDYYKRAEKVFVIPGKPIRFVAQGLTYNADADTYLVCGYDMLEKRSSSVFLIDGDKVKQVFLKTKDGEDFYGHCGGLTHHGDLVYVAGSGKGCVYVLRYSDLANAQNGGSVCFCGKVDCHLDSGDKLRVSFAGGNQNGLFVGEYYSPAGYDTPDTHKAECDGEKFGSVVLEYAFDDNAEFGLSPTPKRALSVADKVQGICLDDNDNIYLSTSGAYASSYIMKFDGSALKRMDDMIIDGNAVPHYATVSTALKKTMKAPPMAEEIIIKDGKLYVVNEYASSPYLLARFTGAKYCYALSLDEFE